MMKVTDELRRELTSTIKGIKLLSRVNKEIRSQLVEVIEADKVEGIFNEELTIDNLNDTEKFNFLKVLFNFAKDERFNPILLTEQAKPNTSAKDNEDSDKEPTKDEMPELYYDFDFKVKFANEYKKDTSRVIMALFRKTAPMEKLKAKDIYEFDIQELSELFKSLKAKTIRSLQNTISTTERYIKFAQDNKRTKYKLNYASAFDSKDKLEKLLNKEAEENMIFDKDEIMDMAMNSDNAQDGVILGLLFDGVSHKAEFEELCELVINQCDLDEKEIKLEDRTIPLSDETAILIKNAMDEDIYVSIKGETSRKYKITQGNHVLRGLRGKDRVKGQIISQRILRIAEIFEYPYLNATTVSYSGQIYLANQLIENEKLTVDEAVLRVLNQYGVPVNDSSKFYLRTRVEKYLNLK